MDRTRVLDVLNGELIGQRVAVKGWVKAFRQNRFLIINDGSALANLQAVVDVANFDEALIREVTTGAPRFLELLSFSSVLSFSGSPFASLVLPSLLF